MYTKQLLEGLSKSHLKHANLDVEINTQGMNKERKHENQSNFDKAR